MGWVRLHELNFANPKLTQPMLEKRKRKKRIQPTHKTN
jgi:hypothetical protein